MSASDLSRSIKLCPTCGSPEPGARYLSAPWVGDPCLDPFHGPLYTPDRRPPDPQRGSVKAEEGQKRCSTCGSTDPKVWGTFVYQTSNCPNPFHGSDSARLDKLELIQARTLARFWVPVEVGFLLTQSTGLLAIRGVYGKARATLREAIDDAEEMG